MAKYSSTYTIIGDNMYSYNYRLTPISLLMFIQDSFARLTTVNNVAAFHIIKNNLIWVITEINVEFIKELPFWSEDIKVEIWVSEVSGLKVYTDYKVYNRGEIIAMGNMLWLVIDKESKKICRVDQFADKLDQYDELVLGKHTKFILPEQREKIVEITYTTNYADVDMNDHVNNKSYIRIAEMTAPESFERTHMPKMLKVKFNRETFLGDVLTCTAYATDKQNNFVHKITKEGISVCDIETLWAERTDNTNIADFNLYLTKG